VELYARPLTDLPFVVVDVETTGLWPKTDRIVEVAIADIRGGHLEGLVVDTLVDPQRDVGPTRIHGVTAEMVQGAPRFRDIARPVSSALHRGVIVGHNLAFDLRFLGAETAAAGQEFPADLPRVCTLSLARRLFRGEFDSFKLEALCRRFGLSNPRAHSAGGDALVTAQLLELLLSEATARGLRTFGDLVRLGAAPTPCGAPSENQPLPIVRQRPRRDVVASTTKNRGSFMTRLIASRSDGSRPEAEPELDTYLELLDRMLRDRIIDLSEQEVLSRLVSEWGLDRINLRRAHRTYLEGLVTVAWSDGVLTPLEREDLERVADTLAVPRDELEAMCQARAPSEPAAMRAQKCPGRRAPKRIGQGRSICITGELAGPTGGGITRAEAESLAEQAGFQWKSGVTKKLDLLVVADPNSCSSKAKKARQYGIELVAESVFWRDMGLA